MAASSKSQAYIEKVSAVLLVIIISFLLILQIPVKYVAAIFWTVPLIYLIKKNYLYSAIIAVAVSSILVFYRGLSTDYITFLVQFIPLVILIGIIFKSGFPAGKGLLLVMLACLIVNSLIITATLKTTQTKLNNWQQEMQIDIHDTMNSLAQDNTLKNYQKMGVSESDIKDALVFDNFLIRQMIYLVPGILTLGYILTAIIIYLIAHRIFYSRKLQIPRFELWELPWQVNIFVILGVCLALIGDNYSINGMTITGLNIILVVTPFIFIIGLSIVVFYLRKFKLSLLGKMLTLLMFLISPLIFLTVIMLLGVFDPYMDIRRLKVKNDNLTGGLK